MNPGDSPQLTSCPVEAFDRNDWTSIGAAFDPAESIALKQSWLPQAETEFRPAHVKSGWRQDALLVYAELEDVDIFNPCVELNELSFKHGDVFEMFLQPVGQLSYFEFHVTPGNQKLQLRIPSRDEFAKRSRSPVIPQEWMISHRVIESHVEVNPESHRWRVLAEIPFELVAELHPPIEGDQWKFSFSRYDYTRGRPRPVLSSSSPHIRLDFHRQEEWGTLTFAKAARSRF